MAAAAWEKSRSTISGHSVHRIAASAPCSASIGSLVTASAASSAGQQVRVTAASHATTLDAGHRSSRATWRPGLSRTSFVPGLKASPSTAMAAAAEAVQAVRQGPDHPASLQLVDLLGRAHQVHRLAGRAADADQRRDVLGQAAAAVADSRPKVARPDPRIHADARRVTSGSAPLCSARRAISLANETRMARKALDPYFASSAVLGSVMHRRRRREGHQVAEALGRLAVLRADQDPGWLAEVLEGSTLLEELGVRDDRARRRRSGGSISSCAHCDRPRRHRAADHDDVLCAGASRSLARSTPAPGAASRGSGTPRPPAGSGPPGT